MSRRRKIKLTGGAIVARVFLGICVVITALPLLWMLRTAFSYNQDLFTDPASWFPEHFTWVNFIRVLGFASPEQIAASGSTTSIDFFRFLANSLVFTAVTMTSQVIFCTAAGYVFAQAKFRGRNSVFFLFLVGLFIPAILIVLPNFVLIRDLGWIDTFQGLIAPFFLMTPFGVFFMRQFFLGFPRELVEAARTDGLTMIGTFVRIALPTSWPSVVTLAVIVGVTQWQEFLWPLLVTKSAQSQTLTVAMAAFNAQSQGRQPDWSGLMAASTLSVIPVFIVLLLLGRRLVGSIQFTGLR